MITFFNSTTVYLGFDLQKFNETLAFLKANGVKYKLKMHNMNPRGRGHTGSIGIRPEYSVQYEILIHNKDAERLGYLRR